MKTNLFLAAVAVAVINLSLIQQLCAQSADTIVISPRVGKIIDVEERNCYNLFPLINGFESAVALLLDDGSYVLEVTFKDEQSGIEKIRELPQSEFRIKELKEKIDEIDKAKVKAGLAANQDIKIDSVNTQIYIAPYNLSGPRIGFTFLSNHYRSTIKDKYKKSLSPVVAQFGWQLEKRFFTVRSGFTAVSEWVLLIGGFDQELFLPSLTWLIGARSPSGFEVGAGPNVSASGTAFVVASGVTLSYGDVGFPINVAVATSKSGLRFSVLLGFTVKQFN